MPRVPVSDLPVSVQTLYADLVDRAWESDYRELVQSGGTPYTRTVKGREYWYVRPPKALGHRSKDIYVGPDSEEVRARIAGHNAVKAVRQDRTAMVRSLRAARLPGPDRLSGNIMSALSQAGAFRLRALIVGTAAFQTYSPMLGVRFNHTSAQTGDLDIAQFRCVSLAVQDEITDDFLNTLREVDPRFEAIPSPTDGRRTMRYAMREGGQELFSVDVLSPMRGKDQGRVGRLPALRTDSQQVQYLDFLLYREVNAVALHGLGVPINVPEPERYAVHKMIVSQERSDHPRSQTKSKKDLAQASELILALAACRAYELKDVWDEANDRGPAWRENLSQALKYITREAKEALLSL